MDLAATQKWLTDEMGFTAEEATALAPQFVSGDRGQRLDKSIKRQSDYNRAMDELRKADAALQSEIAEWGKATRDGEAVTQKMRDDLEKSQQEVLRLQQVAKRIAEAAGVDPATIAVTPVPPTTPQPPAPPDLSGYARLEQLQQIAALPLDLYPELDDLRFEHQELTGQRLNTREIIDEIKTRAQTRGNQKSLNPRDIWMEKHDIPAKRTAKQEADQKARDEAAEKRGYERAMTEGALPGQGGGTPTRPRHDAPSPLFSGQRESAVKRPQPGGRVAAATAAFRSGKYADQSRGAATTP